MRGIKSIVEELERKRDSRDNFHPHLREGLEYAVRIIRYEMKKDEERKLEKKKLKKHHGKSN